MNAINKPNEVSMFKVGDKVVGTKLVDDRIFEYQYELPELSMAVISKDGAAIGLNQLRHATPEEIEVGHRIESSNSQAISDCSLSNLCKNDTQNSLSIKQENQDVGDDAHIENHISPNSKKYDERVK